MVWPMVRSVHPYLTAKVLGGMVASCAQLGGLVLDGIALVSDGIDTHSVLVRS